MIEKLESSLKAIKALEEEKGLLEERINAERQVVFKVLQDVGVDQYKTEIATVSYVERKSVKYQDRGAILNRLEEMNLPKYIEVIPARKEINKQFEDDIKNGVFKLDGVDVEVKALPQIRFNK